MVNSICEDLGHIKKPVRVVAAESWVLPPSVCVNILLDQLNSCVI